MEINALPRFDESDNSTGCCPRFNPDGWDAQELHFKDKLFLRVETRSEDHVPRDMAEKFEQAFAAIGKAGAYDPTNTIVLSRDLSATKAEHFFAVTKLVPDFEMVRWTGDYVTKVFEGPYPDAQFWFDAFSQALAEKGTPARTIYMFYTTCPNCAAIYGKNYVVAVAELAPTTH